MALLGKVEKNQFRGAISHAQPRGEDAEKPVCAYFFLGAAAGAGGGAGFTSAAAFCKSVIAEAFNSYSAGSFSRLAMYRSPFFAISAFSTRFPLSDVTVTSIADVVKPLSGNFVAVKSRISLTSVLTLPSSIFVPFDHQSDPPRVRK